MTQIDTAVLAKLTASLMDDLEADPDEADSMITTAAIVVELHGPDGRVGIGFKCSDSRAWFQAAFLEAAAQVARNHD